MESAAHAAELTRDRDTDTYQDLLLEMANELPPLIDRFYSDSSEWADYHNDAFTEHSALAKETLREMAEQIHLDPENADYAEYGRYVWKLMDAYMRAI